MPLRPIVLVSALAAFSPLLAQAADPVVNQGLAAAARASWLRTFAPAVVGPAYDSAFGIERAQDKVALS